MDGETTEGCEQAAIPGIGQGSIGGSVPAGDNQIHGSEITLILGAKYFVRYKDKLQLFTLVSVHDFQSAVTVENGVGPITVKRSELIPEAVQRLAWFTEKQAHFKDKYGLAIKLFESGATTAKAIGVALQITPRLAGRILKTLRTYLLIDSTPIDLEETSHESTNRDIPAREPGTDP